MWTQGNVAALELVYQINNTLVTIFDNHVFLCEVLLPYELVVECVPFDMSPVSRNVGGFMKKCKDSIQMCNDDRC